MTKKQKSQEKHQTRPKRKRCARLTVWLPLISMGTAGHEPSSESSRSMQDGCLPVLYHMSIAHACFHRQRRGGSTSLRSSWPVSARKTGSACGGGARMIAASQLVRRGSVLFYTPSGVKETASTRIGCLPSDGPVGPRRSVWFLATVGVWRPADGSCVLSDHGFVLSCPLADTR